MNVETLKAAIVAVCSTISHYVLNVLTETPKLGEDVENQLTAWAVAARRDEGQRENLQKKIRAAARYKMFVPASDKQKHTDLAKEIASLRKELDAMKGEQAEKLFMENAPVTDELIRDARLGEYAPRIPRDSVVVETHTTTVTGTIAYVAGKLGIAGDKRLASKIKAVCEDKGFEYEFLTSVDTEASK